MTIRTRFGQLREARLNRKFYLWKFAALAGLCLLIAATADQVYLTVILKRSVFSVISFDRVQTFFLLFWFIGLYLLIGYRTMNKFCYRYRWVLAGCLLLFLTLNRYHGSSIGMFDYYIQPGLGGENMHPVLGFPRSIRSDEWLVSTPYAISAKYSGFGFYNDVINGLTSPNISSSGLYFGYSALAHIFTLGFYVLGFDYAFSIYWYAPAILSVMISFEFCMIITGFRKRVSLLGAFVIGFSPFFLWWSQQPEVLFLLAIFVSLYYFLHTGKNWVKVLLGTATAIAGADFVAILYPAWQVPMGFLLLGLLVWMVMKNIEFVKRLRLFDYFLIAGCILFMISIIAVYLKDMSAYIGQILSTVYPGARISTGGNALYKLFNYVASAMFPLRNAGNPSELSTMVTFFPLPLILLIRQMIKRRKCDSLSVVLLAATVVFGSYITVGWPEWLAKPTLMSYSPEVRCADVFALIQSIILIVVLARATRETKLPWYSGIPLAAGTVFFAYYVLFSTNDADYPLPVWYICVVGVILTAFCIAVFVKLPEKRQLRNLISTAVPLMIVFLFLIGAVVNPVMKGMNVLFEKPVAKVVRELVEQDPQAKWMTTDLISSSYLVANGAPCVTSVNKVPNMALWHVLDPAGNYNDVYNRYAHIALEFTNDKTSFELIQADYMRIKLSYDDIILTGCRYILARQALQGGGTAVFRQIYAESGCYIYEISYK